MAIRDATFCQVVWRNLQRDAITGSDTNKMLPHLTRNVRKNFMIILQLDTIHRGRQDLHDRSLKFYVIIFCH